LGLDGNSYNTHFLFILKLGCEGKKPAEFIVHAELRRRQFLLSRPVVLITKTHSKKLFVIFGEKPLQCPLMQDRMFNAQFLI